MKFSVDKNLTFEQAVAIMFDKLGDSKIMALASSVNDYVMVRNVSCLFYDKKQAYVKKYDAATKKETRVNVTVGLSGDENVEVSGEGLRQGDTLLVKQLQAKQTSNFGGPPM